MTRTRGAAAMAAVCALIAGVSANAAVAQSIDKSKMQACAIAPADIKKAMGIEVKAGKATEIAYPEGRMLSCSYASPTGSTALILSQTWIPTKILTATLESMDRYASGKLVPITGDPDQARWQLDPEQPNNLALHYTRKNVRTELRAQGGRFLVEEMRPKLLKLKRVP